MPKIRAAVCREFGKPFSVETIEIADPGPNQISVKLAACAICHSDIAAARGSWGGTLPAIYGHEAAGTVRDIGAEVTGFAPGDRVLVTLIRACGACPACSGGHPTSCDEAYTPIPSPLSDQNGPITQGMSTAAFAEQVVVDQSQCIVLPQDIGLDTASLLACGVITGFGAVTNTADLKPGQSAAVIGAGGVGLNAIQGAAHRGASPLIAIDLTEDKLQDAREFGATHTLLADEDLPERLRAANNGRGVDFLFVAVGAPKAFQDAPQLLAPGGSVVLVGMTSLDAEVTYKPVDLSALNLSLLGSRMGQTVLERDIPLLLELYRTGQLKLDELITNRYSLDEINEAVTSTASGDVRRNVIVFG